MEIYNAQEGTLLGRTANSWFKILAFYAVYYSLLGVLFWGFTITFYQGKMVLQDSPVGGKPAIVHSRLDQPGIASHPFNEMLDYKDSSGDHRVDLSLNGGAYCESVSAYFDKVEDSDTLCSALFGKGEHANSPYDVTCKMSLAVRSEFCAGKPGLCSSGASLANVCTNLLEKHASPVVVLDVNKIVDWTPMNNQARDAIQFNCYEFDAKKDEKVKDSNFKFTPVSEHDSLKRRYFPFPGMKDVANPTRSSTNPAYNKPFAAFAVEPKNGKADWGKDFHDFRCEVIADNINRPTVDGAVAAADLDWSKDLRKINVGFTEFGIKL